MFACALVQAFVVARNEYAIYYLDWRYNVSETELASQEPKTSVESKEKPSSDSSDEAKAK